MAKIFYDHLVQIEEVLIELDNYDLDNKEKEEFISLIDQTLNEQLLNTILSNLPSELHETFLSQFHQAPFRPELMDFLKKESKVDIEKTIKDEATKIKKEILADIKKSQKP